jgi:hypothetical protein
MYSITQSSKQVTHNSFVCWNLCFKCIIDEINNLAEINYLFLFI